MHAAPRLTAQAGGGGEDGEWLTGRVGMDYWMHIGILFSCQEIYSMVRKSIPLNCAFFITVQGHNSDFGAHTPAQLRWTDVALLSDPPLSTVTVCRYKQLISGV